MDEQFYENINVIDSFEKNGFKVEILEYKHLKGSTDVSLAEKLFYVRNAGMSLKQVKVTLKDSAVVTEAGALYFHKGNIEAAANIGGVGGLARKLIKNKLTDESLFTPMYKGSGEVFLEPSFSHFIFLELENDSIVVDKGLFYCCEKGLEVGVATQKTLSSGLLGGEGWFQTKISGSGVCVLEIPVPLNEILKYELKDERVQVDGNFALLRSASVKYSVTKSSKALVGTLTGGEGLLHTFEGTGKVWLAPTQPIYGQLNFGKISELAEATKNVENKT